MLFPQDIFSKIMDYCDTRHRESLKKVLNDLLLVTDIERCENLFGEEVNYWSGKLVVDEDDEVENYDMTEIDPLIQKRLKGLFTRTECLSGFLNNTLWAGYIYLWEYHSDDSKDRNSINYILPVNYIWSV